MTPPSRLNLPCAPDDPALTTPCLLLDEARMAGNIARFNRHLARQGLAAAVQRSAERRVGKECRSRWSPYQ